MDFTKDDIWKAFFVRKQQFKREEEGALTEELKDPEMDVDWALIMEAFSVLTNPEARAEYEQRNLMSHAKLQLTGLRISHESRKREEVQLRPVPDGIRAVHGGFRRSAVPESQSGAQRICDSTDCMSRQLLNGEMLRLAGEK